MGVKVEVWAWRNAISAEYETLKQSSDGKFQIHYLDDYKEEICTQCRYYATFGFCRNGANCPYGHYLR